VSNLEIALIATVVSLLLLAVAGFFLVRSANAEARRLMSRMQKLPMRAKLQLAVDLARDERIPTGLRLIPPLMLLYVSLPIDLIPDFIPFFGQIDDVVVLAIGAGLLLRFAPKRVIEERILALEVAA
jgi:uncharacterized membrane protein YkvA (DUF1232 family)